MKSNLHPLFILFFYSWIMTVSAQVVGVNTTLPQAPMHVQQKEGTVLGSGQSVLRVQYTGSVAGDPRGIHAICKPGGENGIGGFFEGGYIGVEGIVQNNGDRDVYGVYGYVDGGSDFNCGIYGSALGSGDNFAGYFNEGDVFISNNLGIGYLHPIHEIDVLDAQSVVRLTSNDGVNGSVLELRNNTPSPVNYGAINFGTENATPGQIAYLGNDNFIIRVNNAERFRINPSGFVGIGRSPTTYRLEVEGNASKASAGDWMANSDERLKKNIQPLQAEEMINKLLSLKGVTYEWNDDKTGTARPEGVQYGFIAQNIEEVFPTLVEEDALGYLQTAYGTYDAMMVEAIRYLYQENEMLRHEIREIKDMLSGPTGSK